MMNKKYLQLIYLFVICSGGCKKDEVIEPDPVVPVISGEYIYFQSNDPAGNAIFAYKQVNDSTLEMINGSPFSTGGMGYSNSLHTEAPYGDGQIIISPDKRFLLAVNEGSNSISVMNISANGSLTPVSGSPFPSGGLNPVSLAMHNNMVYVVNKSIDNNTAVKPDYSVFTINSSGLLSNISNATIETLIGTSPSNVLISNDGKFLFATEYLGYSLNPPSGTLRSFSISGTDTLSPTSSPQTIPVQGGALGICQNPAGNSVYVGFPEARKVGVYTINSTSGVLNFSNAVDAGLFTCQLKTNRTGTRLYALNADENTISVFNTTTINSPLTIGNFQLKNPGSMWSHSGVTATASSPLSFSFSNDEKNMYVLNQHTNPDTTIGNFNLLHILKIDGNGFLSEPYSPMNLSIQNTVRPMGIVTVKIN